MTFRVTISSYYGFEKTVPAATRTTQKGWISSPLWQVLVRGEYLETGGPAHCSALPLFSFIAPLDVTLAGMAPFQGLQVPGCQRHVGRLGLFFLATLTLFIQQKHTPSPRRVIFIRTRSLHPTSLILTVPLPRLSPSTRADDIPAHPEAITDSASGGA